LLCSPAWPWTWAHPASNSLVLWLQAYFTTPDVIKCFYRLSNMNTEMTTQAKSVRSIRGYSYVMLEKKSRIQNMV
jgi:hypothetical protein